MLIIEDGSIVPGANSLVTRQEYVEYANSVGVFVRPDIDADVELVKAMQFISSKEPVMKGRRVERDQSLPFPRSGMVIDGWEWGHNEIPRQAILAQLAVALDIHSGIDPYNPPPNPNPIVKSERVEGAVDVTYAVSDTASKLSRESTAMALINSMLERSGLFSLMAVRG